MTDTDETAKDVCERHGFVEVDRARYYEFLGPKNPDGYDVKFFGETKRYAIGVNCAGRTALCARISDGWMIEPTRYFIPISA